MKNAAWMLVVVLLGLSVSDRVWSRAPQEGEEPSRPAVTKTIDPCMVATADQLRPSLANVVKGYFLFKYSQGGEFAALIGGNLTDAACPNLRVSVLAQVTTGVPAGAQGTACLSDIDLTALNLPNAPCWLNNSWFKARLNEKRIRPCFDMAAPGDAFLQRGGRLQGMEGDWR